MAVYAHFDTTLGKFTVELFETKTPKTVANFVGLAEGTKEWKHPKTGEKHKKPYFDGIIFHRIINGFMCQGGDPTGTGRGGPGYKFNDEPVKQRYQLGSLVMANAGPNTNGSQFFLISGPNGVGLPPQYNHFGQVVKGLEIVDAMQKVATDSSDRPRTPVVIKSVTIAVAD